MIVQDFNLTLKPPDGYAPVGVFADGAYIQIQYWRDTAIKDIADRSGVASECVMIYLNSDGREVLRTYNRTENFALAEHPPTAPVSRRFRLKNGFLLALEGLQEMFRCLSKSSVK